jgi:hypothetical protein
LTRLPLFVAPTRVVTTRWAHNNRLDRKRDPQDRKYGTAPNHCNGTCRNLHSSFSNNCSSQHFNSLEISFKVMSATRHGHKPWPNTPPNDFNGKNHRQRFQLSGHVAQTKCKRRRDRLCSVRGLLAVAWLQPLTLRGGGEVEKEKRERENLPPVAPTGDWKADWNDAPTRRSSNNGLTLCLTFFSFSYLRSGRISGKHSLVNFSCSLPDPVHLQLRSVSESKISPIFFQPVITLDYGQ